MGAHTDLAEQKRVEERLAKKAIALQRANKRLKDVRVTLEARVERRTRELATAHAAQKELARELEAALADLESLTERLQEENVYLKEEIRSTDNFEGIIGTSAAITETLENVRLVAAAYGTYFGTASRRRRSATA